MHGKEALQYVLYTAPRHLSTEARGNNEDGERCLSTCVHCVAPISRKPSASAAGKPVIALSVATASGSIFGLAN